MALSDDIAQDLIRDEGMIFKPYRDSVGKWTIGVGRNLDDHGISEAEARILLANDIDRASADLDVQTPWWKTLPQPARRGLLNMSFNLGWPKLSRFKEMLSALQNRDFKGAASAALDSLWARQVGERADRIADLFTQES